MKKQKDAARAATKEKVDTAWGGTALPADVPSDGLSANAAVPGIIANTAAAAAAEIILIVFLFFIISP